MSLDTVLRQLETIASQAFHELDSVSDLGKLESWRIRYLGKKSELSQILRSLASLPLGERRVVGAEANKATGNLKNRFLEKKRFLEEHYLTSLKPEELDITLPGEPFSLGKLHPITQILNEIQDVFTGMGFQIVEGPDVEWDYYNFEMLNIPEDHPARDMFSTFWIDFATETGKRSMLLRTHTSPMQIRIMEKTGPPVRVIVPGRVYRYEATDATHESMFHQVEGLVVDKGITMADLKGTLFELARCLFGEGRKVRFRCDYFPFVEPGVEMAIECLVCRGAGCRLCAYTGWIEILGAGMVHPEVLRRVDIDPAVYTGFAFGMGVDRIPMLRYGINDIRFFYSNDIRFLRQF